MPFLAVYIRHAPLPKVLNFICTQQQVHPPYDTVARLRPRLLVGLGRGTRCIGSLVLLCSVQKSMYARLMNVRSTTTAAAVVAVAAVY